MITCPSCNTENQLDARFCISCGTPLATAPAQPSSAPAPDLTPLAESEPIPAADMAPLISPEAAPVPPPISPSPSAQMTPPPPILGAGYVAQPSPTGYALQPGYTPPYPAYAPRPPKDRSIALILEILPGLFGLIGFGWIYSGNTGAGIAWLIGVLIWDVVAIIISLLTAGFGCFCTIPANIVLVAISAVTLNSYTKQHRELFG